MNRSQGLSSLKRKQPDSKSPIESLTEHKRILYNLIRRKQDMAIWTRDMKNIPDNVLHKSPKSLQARKLIKEVVTIQNKGRKHYIATEFEPSKEITGGAWYVEGSLDTEFINFLKKHCVKIIYEQKIVTLEEILDTIRRSRAFNVEFTTQQIEEIANYIATEFEPSKEITGGAWYVEGSLDTEFINFLKKHCVKIIYEQKIVTLEEILDTIRRSRAFNVEFTTQQIEEIANALVLDKRYWR
nr:dna-directed rna polymerase iii subunit rpc6 [Quercus suber]